MMSAERLRLAEARSSSARREPPPVTRANRPNRVYVSVGGIMSCTNPTEPDADHPGQKRLKRQQMKVGCVDWQDDRQRWQKQMVWGRESPEEFAASLWRLAMQCGYGQAFIAKATFPRQSIVIANPPPVAVRGGRRRLVLGHSGP